MNKNAYIIEDINNSLYLMELSGVGIFIEKFFVRKNLLKKSKIIKAKNIIVNDYINEILNYNGSKNTHNNENYNYRLSSFVNAFFSKYYLEKFKEELIKSNKVINTTNVSYYDYMSQHNVNNIAAFNYSFDLEMNLKSKEILNQEIRDILKEKNFIFMFELLLSIFENQSPILVQNEIIDYSKIGSFDFFIAEIYRLTNNKDLLEYKLDKFNFLSKKYEEDDFKMEVEELPF